MMVPMGTTWGQQVVHATSQVHDVLHGLADRDWDAPAGGLTWSCHQTARHIAGDLTKYATQLAGRVDDAYLRFAVTAAPDEPLEELLRLIDACGRLLGTVVDSAPPEARAWHWGPTDASGFAAMGIGELLVHTYDITSGLGADWRPPADLAELVVSRLMEHAPSIARPSSLLLWATGRMELPGRQHVSDWVWRAADR